MAFHYHNIRHFRCNNQLSSPVGRVALLFGLKFCTRGMWAVMQMAGEEDLSRCTIDCLCLGHLLKHCFVLPCTANSCDEKVLNGPSRKVMVYFLLAPCLQHWFLQYCHLQRDMQLLRLSQKAKAYSNSLVLYISVLQINTENVFLIKDQSDI